MSYRVRIESFEGPFDLLLYLVSRQKVDIGSISITEIVDQYVAYIDRMQKLDLDVASDFLLVASTLLDIKAASLIPSEKTEVEDELEELSPNEAREILIEKLIAYKQYKNVAAALNRRFELEGRMHPRLCGPDQEFLGIMPDYLESTSLDSLAFLCAEVMARREVFLDGEPLMLTFKEFELLAHLVENSSRTVGREELLKALWSSGDEHPHERTIDVHIRRLRSKLGRLSGTVRTVRGQGYRFFEHPEVVVWAAPEYSI